MNGTENGATSRFGGMHRHVDRHTLAPTTDAPAQARSALRAALHDDDRFDVAALGLSELVTNALMHGRSRRGSGSDEPIELRIATEADSLRIAVRDTGGGFDAADSDARRRDRLTTRTAGERPAEGGWGLEIVAAIAADWGVERSGDGTVVWFAL